jgi:hypothetical protein
VSRVVTDRDAVGACISFADDHRHRYLCTVIPGQTQA